MFTAARFAICAAIFQEWCKNAVGEKPDCLQSWAGRRTMNEHLPMASATATPGNRAKVFVSYSRKDLAFAQMMVGALAKLGFDAFLDKTDIAPGEPWKERLAGLIATADTVVFTVSPDSVASTICGWELEESARLGKRIIPVVARRIADADAPPALGRLNWVFLADADDKDAALATLNTRAYRPALGARAHAAWRLARRWNEQGGGKARRCAALTSKLPNVGSIAALPTPMRRPIYTRISSGRAGALRPQGSVIGSAARLPSPSSQLLSPLSPKLAAARPRHSASAPSTRSVWRPAPRMAWSSTWRRNSAMSSACRPRRSRTFLIGHDSCRTSFSEQANRIQVCV